MAWMVIIEVNCGKWMRTRPFCLENWVCRLGSEGDARKKFYVLVSFLFQVQRVIRPAQGGRRTNLQLKTGKLMPPSTGDVLYVKHVGIPVLDPTCKQVAW